MGTATSFLCSLLCKYRCSPSQIASLLAFHPPYPPSYQIIDNNKDDSLSSSSSSPLISARNAAGSRPPYGPERYTIFLIHPYLAQSLHPERFAGSFKIIRLRSGPSNQFINVFVFTCKEFERYHSETNSNRDIESNIPKSGHDIRTVLFSHGNACDCGLMLPRYADMCDKLCVNVVAYDYSGYGPSSIVSSEQEAISYYQAFMNAARASSSSRGTIAPSQSNSSISAHMQERITPTVNYTYENIKAVYDWIVNESGLLASRNPSRELIVYGQSVGSGPSCKLAIDRQRPICGLILHSPIMSGIRVISQNRGPLACFDIYPNISRINYVRCPVLVIHGEDDEEVTVNHGKSIQNNVPEQFRTTPLYVRGAGHNDIVESFPVQYYRRMKDFLAHIQSFHAEEGSNPNQPYGYQQKNHSSFASVNDDILDRSYQVREDYDDDDDQRESGYIGNNLVSHTGSDNTNQEKMILL